MRRPRSAGDGERPDEEVEGPLEDAASLLREPVDVGRSLLDEAELGAEEVPPGLAETAEIEFAAEEREAALEAESVIAPPARGQSGAGIDSEDLEAWLEAETEPAELLALHDREPLCEALLDEGTPLDELEGDAVEEAVERRAEDRREGEGAATFGRPVRSSAASPPAVGPSVRARGIDAGRARSLLEAARLRLEALQAEFEEEGLRQRSEREDLSSLSAVDQHPADQGTETFDRERDLSIRERVEGELVEVRRARQRLDDGTYGLCEACGRPIGADRLVAEPATRLCLDDQRELEREVALKHREVEL